MQKWKQPSYQRFQEERTKKQHQHCLFDLQWDFNESHESTCNSLTFIEVVRSVFHYTHIYIRIKYSFNAISVFFFCRSSTAVVWNLNLMQINDQIQQLIFNLYSFATKTEYRKTNRFSKRKQSFRNDESHNTILNMLNRKHSRNDGYWNEVAQLYPIFEWILLCSSVDFIFTLILKTEVQFLRTFCKILKSQNGPFMKCLHLKIELELSWFNDESVFIVSETKK